MGGGGLMSEVPLYSHSKTWSATSGEALVNRGTLLIRKRHPPQEHRRILGLGLLQGPREGLFLMSEVPLHPPTLKLYPSGLFPGLSPNLHGRLQPSHQKSTRITQLTSIIHVVQTCSRGDHVPLN